MNSLAFLGDVYFKNEINEIDINEPYIFNYECAIADEQYTPMTNKINLRAKPGFKGVSRLPIAVNLANNHMFDFMDQGFYETKKELDDHGVKYFGAGTAQDNYSNPCIVEVYGKKIALLGYSDVYHSLEQVSTQCSVARPGQKQVKDDITFCREQNVDAVIINIHWGREERFWYTARQQELGRMFIDLGADLVIGHHSHCIQPVECYKNKYIFYSLGNAVFPDIAEPSYYKEDGSYEFIMHKKHFRYGRKSLKVIFDLETNTVIDIKRMKYSKGKLSEQNSIAYDKVIPKIYKSHFVNEITGYFHMAGLFVKSYLFADKKLFSLSAVRKELEFLKHRKEK